MTETTVGHCKRDQCDVYIGRGGNGDSRTHLNNTAIGEYGWLGNPYPLDEGYSREESVARFVDDLLERVDSDPEFRKALFELQGSVLGCWCRQHHEDAPLCHGDALATVIDGIERTSR